MDDIIIKSKNEHITVFRDEDELTGCNDLPQEIQQRLSESEYLIVICTPDLAESTYCKQEIEYFKRINNGSNEKIIPVLIEGTPEQSFLFNDDYFENERAIKWEICHTVVDGNVVKTDPYAISIVATDTPWFLQKRRQNSSLCLLEKKEYLRIISRLYIDEFGAKADFSVLYDRHKERELQKRKSVIGFTSCILSAFLLLSLIFSYSTLQKNRHISLLNSETLSEESKLLWEKGEYFPAISKGIAALPEKGSNYSENAMLNLAEEIGAFKPVTFQPYVQLKYEGKLEFSSFVNNGKTVISADNYCFYFHNAQTGELIGKLYYQELGFVGTHSAPNILFFNADQLFFAYEGVVACLNCKKMTLMWSRPVTGAILTEKFTSSPAVYQIECTDGQTGIYELDSATGAKDRLLAKIDRDVNVQDAAAIHYDRKSNTLYLMMTEGEKRSLIAVKAGAGSIAEPLQILSLSGKSYGSYTAIFSNDRLLFSIVETDTGIKLFGISKKTNRVVWEKGIATHAVENNSATIESRIVSMNNNSHEKDFVLLCCDNYLYCLKTSNGESLFSKAFSEKITLCKYTKDKLIIVSGQSIFELDPSSFPMPGYWAEYKKYRKIELNGDLCAEYDDTFIVAKAFDSEAYIFTNFENKDFISTEKICEIEDAEIIINQKGTTYLIQQESDDGTYKYYSCSASKTGITNIQEVSGNQGLAFLCFLEKNIACFSGQGQTLFYDLNDAQWINAFKDNDYYLSTESHGKYVFFIKENAIIRCTLDGEPEIWSNDQYKYSLLDAEFSSDGNRMLLVLQDKVTQTFSLSIYDFETKKLSSVPVEAPLDTEDYSRERILFLNNSVIAVCSVKDFVIRFVDTNNMRVFPSVISETSQTKAGISSLSQVSALYYFEENDTFLVVREDNSIDVYQNLLRNLKKNRTPANVHINLDILKRNPTDARTLSFASFKKGQILIAKIGDGTPYTEALILDADSLNPIFHIDNYADYSSAEDRIYCWEPIKKFADNDDIIISTATRNCGSYPLYTASELKSKAESVIRFEQN